LLVLCAPRHILLISFVNELIPFGGIALAGFTRVYTTGAQSITGGRVTIRLLEIANEVTAIF
jgi:hypothetical protein